MYMMTSDEKIHPREHIIVLNALYVENTMMLINAFDCEIISSVNACVDSYLLLKQGQRPCKEQLIETTYM